MMTYYVQAKLSRVGYDDALSDISRPVETTDDFVIHKSTDV